MKKIKYLFKEHRIELPWNESNETMARIEADNNTYEIQDYDVEGTSLPTLTERLETIELLFEKLKALLPDIVG